MEIIRKKLKLQKEEFNKKHLLIINHLLPVQMTNREAEVLAAFLALEGDLAKDPFSTTGRKIVMGKLGLKPGGLGNFIRDLKKKKLILETEEEELYLLPVLIPQEGRQLYQFVLEVE